MGGPAQSDERKIRRHACIAQDVIGMKESKSVKLPRTGRGSCIVVNAAISYGETRRRKRLETDISILPNLN